MSMSILNALLNLDYRQHAKGSQRSIRQVLHLYVCLLFRIRKKLKLTHFKFLPRPLDSGHFRYSNFVLLYKFVVWAAPVLFRSTPVRSGSHCGILVQPEQKIPDPVHFYF